MIKWGPVYSLFFFKVIFFLSFFLLLQLGGGFGHILKDHVPYHDISNSVCRMSSAEA